MKSREIIERVSIRDYIAETLLEWIEYLFYLFKGKRKWSSNLTEVYQIYKKHSREQFVIDFLKERRNILSKNNYKMKQENIDEECNEDTIGRVLLCRKKKIISSAILKTKKSDSSNCKLIYWSFEK